MSYLYKPLKDLPLILAILLFTPVHWLIAFHQNPCLFTVDFFEVQATLVSKVGRERSVSVAGEQRSKARVSVNKLCLLRVREREERKAGSVCF